MAKKYIEFCALVLALSLSQPSRATIIYDDFNTPHDYLISGVGGTVWDGFVGLGEGERATSMNADINEPNGLYLGTINSYWEPPFDPLGPFLYKNVKSDNWIIMTRVSNYPEGVYWNIFGIMIRASTDPDEAGPGEDSEQLGHFEVTRATIVQSMDEGEQVADLCFGMLAPYLRIRQVTEVNELGDANTILHYEVSFDGKEWTAHPLSPRLRNDFTGLTLQLGMNHAVYTPDTYGWGAFGETIILYRGEGQAWYESPEYNASNIDLKPTLYWSPGPYVKSPQGHEVYLSNDISKVEGRDVSVKTVRDTNSYPITSFLDLDMVYYWCVDEVNDTCAPGEWEGDIWHFSTNTGKATEPIPYDVIVPFDIEQLCWTQNKYAVTQDFYFGEDANEVATSVTPLISDIPNDINYIDLANEGISLEPAKTYYWRIDSNCGDLGTAKGDIWYFSTWYPYTLCDDFEDDWDYFMGTDGTIWDGIIGTECMICILTDMNDGHLIIESFGCCWAGNDHSVLLYTDTVGNFAATVEITDFLGLYVDRGSALPTNNAGIMARVSDLDLAGPGEDWISIDYFPGWGVGIIIRLCDDGVRYEIGAEMNGWEANRYLQMERRGNTFHLSRSPDGIVYHPSLESPVEREDFNGLDLQVGLHHSTCSSVMAWAEYDNFCLGRNAVEKAYAPNPAGGGMLDLMKGILSWMEGDYATLHRIYFSSDFNDVNNRVEDTNRGQEEVVPIGSGRFSYDAGQYENLSIGGTYYWCVDEIGDVDPCLWAGDVWRFTVQDYSLIDNFESYTGTGKSKPPPAGTLKKVWVDGNYAFSLFPPIPGTSGSLIELSEDIAQSGSQSMKFYYDNDGYVEWESILYGCYPPEACNYIPVPDTYLSEVYAAIDDAAAEINLDSLDLKRDWSIYKVLGLSFYGDPNNDIEPMYIGLEDDDGTVVAISYNGSSSDVTEPWWHDWYVALSEFTDKDTSLDLTEIARIYIGFGDKDNPVPGGTGFVFFDDILLYATPQCVPDSVLGDFDDNCVLDNRDLEIFTYNFPGEMPTLPNPIIHLSAAGLPLGPLSSWANEVDDSGVFVDVNLLDANIPVVETILGKKCVTFDSTDMLIWDENAPSTITGDSDYTVIYEIYNPEIGNEEWLFNWAMRGGPERTCAGFGYGNNAEFGCIIHWDPPGDMGFDAGVPAARRWHVIAATYDGKNESVIVDGLVHNRETKDLLVHMDQPVTIGAPYAIPADPNEAYIIGTYVPTYNLRFTGSVASIRVYGEAVPPGDLAIVTATMAGLSNAEADVKPDSKIDFGDLAIIGNNWMQDAMLLGDD